MDEPTDWIPLDYEGVFALIGPVYQLRASGPTARFRFLAEPKHANRSHFVDGGMLTAFADSALVTLVGMQTPASMACWSGYHPDKYGNCQPNIAETPRYCDQPGLMYQPAPWGWTCVPIPQGY